MFQFLRQLWHRLCARLRFCGGVQYLAGTASLPSPLSPTLLETVGQQAITVTFGQLTTTFEVTVREDIVTLETTLEDATSDLPKKADDK